MNSLADALGANLEQIEAHMYVGVGGCRDLISRVRQYPSASSEHVVELVWTFLAACGYACAGKSGVARLAEVLTGSGQSEPTDPKIWLEVLPIPPREGEGGTHVDLALGTIAVRPGRKSGVEVDNVESPWICFCEMKWHSDIAPSVRYDLRRNQLARLAENAVCFQGSGRRAERVYVTLVTPADLRHGPPWSPLYQYKFDQYDKDRARLIEDLDACVLAVNEQADWTYPADRDERARALWLRWVTYESLFEALRGSAIAGELRSFWAQHGSSQRRQPDR